MRRGSTGSKRCDGVKARLDRDSRAQLAAGILPAPHERIRFASRARCVRYLPRSAAAVHHCVFPVWPNGPQFWGPAPAGFDGGKRPGVEPDLVVRVGAPHCDCLALWQSWGTPPLTTCSALSPVASIGRYKSFPVAPSRPLAMHGTPRSADSQHRLESFARSCGVSWGRNVPPGERICVASAFHFCAPRTHGPIRSGCSTCCRDADPAICRTAYADAPGSASDDFCPAARQVGCDGQEGDQARGPRFKAHMEYARRDRGGAKRRVPRTISPCAHTPRRPPSKLPLARGRPPHVPSPLTAASCVLTR